MHFPGFDVPIRANYPSRSVKRLLQFDIDKLKVQQRHWRPVNVLVQCPVWRLVIGQCYVKLPKPFILKRHKVSVIDKYTIDWPTTSICATFYTLCTFSDWAGRCVKNVLDVTNGHVKGCWERPLVIECGRPSTAVRSELFARFQQYFIIELFHYYMQLDSIFQPRPSSQQINGQVISARMESIHWQSGLIPKWPCRMAKR